MHDHGSTIVRGLTLVEALDSSRNEVWRAVTATGDPDRAADSVAVKLLHPAYEPIVPHLLGRQARTIRRIVGNGTKWVRLLDHGYATDGRRYIVSRLYAGSLDDQLGHGPTPWFPATKLIAEAAGALADAHAAGHAFGYIRPSGILLDGVSGVRVAAYGMSTRRFDDGTAQFTAPELVAGEKAMPASDVFSLSLILASLIAGRPIDHNESSAAVVEDLAGTIPSRVLEIVEHGLSINIRNRHADAAKLARSLEMALHEQHTIGPRAQSEPPWDAVDPLTALLAGPLVEPHHRDGIEGVSSGTEAEPDPGPQNVDNPDETPTAIPFDDTPAQIDDPTDPGIAAHGELDAETDHFGSVSGLGTPPPPPNHPSSGPLADLLTVFDRGDDDPTLEG